MPIQACRPFQVSQHRRNAFRLAPRRAKDVQRNHVATAFPDRVQWRLAEQPRHGALFHEADAAVAFECLVDEARLALADPELGRGRGQPHEGGRLLAGRCLVQSGPDPQCKGCGGFAFENQVGEHGPHGGLIDQRLAEGPAVCGMPDRPNESGAHAACRTECAVVPGELNHLDDGRHATPFVADALCPGAVILDLR